MALQYSITLRNAQLDAIETAIGGSPTLEIRTGAPPANCAAAASGTLLASMPLPADWMAAAANGAASMAGVWTDTSADGAGVAGHWRIRQSAVCHMQGTCGMTGSGADMILDNTNIAAGQSVTVTAFSVSAGNA